MIPIWAHLQTAAWDVSIYNTAIRSLRAGHDPYADAIAVQQLVHNRNPNVPTLYGPYSYVYSPMTLPALRLIAMLTPWLAAAFYALAYLAGLAAELWAGFQAVAPDEHRVFLFFVPLVIFFPGLLGSDSVLSGNVATIFYGAAFAAAFFFGWRKGLWRWFYLVVLLASCVKAPMLTLLAIPVFSARRQWLPASATAALGVALFALQPLIWPSLFSNYLKAVFLQFTFNRDFGSSPAGLMTAALYDHHLYSPSAGTALYLAYAIPLAAFLFYMSNRFMRGDFTLRQWVPVLFLGTILLNPRLMEYDTAPLALLLALILWRFLGCFITSWKRTIGFSSIFLAVNLVATHSWNLWKLTEGPLLVALFIAGSWTLVYKAGHAAETSERTSNSHALAV